MNKAAKAVILGVVIAPAVYLLSAGPVAYAEYRLGWVSHSTADALYSPLRYLPKSKLIGVPFTWWIELWLGPGDCGGTGTGG